MRRLQLFLPLFIGIAVVVVGIQYKQAAASVRQNTCINLVAAPDYVNSGRAEDAIEAINNARQQEQVQPLQLPTNFYELSPVQQQFVLVNAERMDRGLSPLTLSATLSRIAQNYSKQLSNLNFFSHTSPIGGTFSKRVNNNPAIHNHYALVAENLSGNPVAGVGPIYEYMYHDASENCGHRNNILAPTLTHIGIGVVNNAIYGSISTQEFVASASWNPYKGSAQPVSPIISVSIKAQFNTKHTSINFNGQIENNSHISCISWFIDSLKQPAFAGLNWTLSLNKLSAGRHTILAYGVDDEQNYGVTQYQVLV